MYTITVTNDSSTTVFTVKVLPERSVIHGTRAWYTLLGSESLLNYDFQLRNREPVTGSVASTHGLPFLQKSLQGRFLGCAMSGQRQNTCSITIANVPVPCLHRGLICDSGNHRLLLAQVSSMWSSNTYINVFNVYACCHRFIMVPFVCYSGVCLGSACSIILVVLLVEKIKIKTLDGNEERCGWLHRLWKPFYTRLLAFVLLKAW